MSEEKSVTINLGITGAFVYLACGMAYHLITSDDVFAWSNPWLYIDMALWPFWLLGWVIALIAIVLAVIFGGAYFRDRITKFKNRKAFEKIQKQQEEEREKRRRDIAKATPPESKT